jgi:hypothetical protein
VPLGLVLLLAALAVALLWMLGALRGPFGRILGALPYSWRSETEVCSHCAVQRLATRSSVAGVKRSGRDIVRETAVSRALGLAGACDHTWYRVWWAGGSDPLLRPVEMTDVGTRFPIIELLLVDDSFAEELADMPDPQQVWFDLLTAAEASPERVDAMVTVWWQSGGERQPFAEWWEENKDTLREP